MERQFNGYRTEPPNNESRAAKETAYRALLKEVGVSEKRIDTVLKVSDIDGIELEDGKIKNADALTESVKKEWADFIEQPDNNGVRVDLGGKVGGGKPESEPTDLRGALHARYDTKG